MPATIFSDEAARRLAPSSDHCVCAWSRRTNQRRLRLYERLSPLLREGRRSANGGELALRGGFHDNKDVDKGVVEAGLVAGAHPEFAFWGLQFCRLSCQRLHTVLFVARYMFLLSVGKAADNPGLGVPGVDGLGRERGTPEHPANRCLILPCSRVWRRGSLRDCRCHHRASVRRGLPGLVDYGFSQRYPY